MRNYWYISLTNEYPRTIDDCSVRVVRSVQIKKKYSIVEMTRKQHRMRSISTIFVTVAMDIGKTNIFNKTLRGTSNE